MQGKVVVITGGAGVLGSALAKGAAELGAKVAILSRTVEKVKKLVGDIQASGGQALALVGDVLDQSSIESACQTALREWHKVDVLINCAGGNMSGATIMPTQDFWELDMDALTSVTDLNFKGTVLPSAVFVKVMAAQGNGSIINISSMAAQQALTRVAGYSAAKAAVDNFTKWLAVEVAKKYGEKIRVNAIAPGFFIADQNRDLLLNSDGSYTDRGRTIVENTPMGRFGNPEELVSTMRWLCDDQSTFVTGIVVPVDGGFSAFSGV